MFDGVLIYRILTLIAFAAIGYWFVAPRLNPPRYLVGWMVLVLAVVLAGIVCVSARMVAVNDTGIYFNNLAQGLGLGILAGFLVRRRAQPATASDA